MTVLFHRSHEDFSPPRDRFNPFAPGVMDDPYPWYQRLRAWDPIHLNPGLFGPGHGAWFLTRYQDVLQAELDAETFVRGKYGELCIESFSGYPSLSQIH